MQLKTVKTIKNNNKLSQRSYGIIFLNEFCLYKILSNPPAMPEPTEWYRLSVSICILYFHPDRVDDNFKLQKNRKIWKRLPKQFFEIFWNSKYPYFLLMDGTVEGKNEFSISRYFFFFVFSSGPYRC